MSLQTWRILGVAGAVAVLTAMGPGVAGQAPVAAKPDVLTELLTEVRGLRAAMEQVASSGPRVQLALGRLQLQEQRVNTLLRRLDEIRSALHQTQSQHESHQQQLKMFEQAMRSSEPGEREEAEKMMAPFTAMVARATLETQRLQGEEAATAQLLASEQARWNDINRGVEDLERSFNRR